MCAQCRRAKLSPVSLVDEITRDFLDLTSLFQTDHSDSDLWRVRCDLRPDTQSLRLDDIIAPMDLKRRKLA